MVLEFSKSILKVIFTSFGGGLLSITAFEREFVETGKIPLDKFNQYVTIGNILPGPVYFYMSSLMGLHFYGVKGCIIGLCLTTFPLGIITLFIYIFLDVVNFDFKIILYCVLPIIIINFLSYFKKLVHLDIKLPIKIIVFLVTMILIVFVKMDVALMLVLYILLLVLIDRIGVKL